VSKNVAVFIDVANLYYSARGQDVDVDYVALLKTATKGRDLIRAYAYSGLDPENENQRKFIDFLSKNGYKVVHKDIRKFGDGRMKANLDIELVVDLFRLQDRMDIAVIVSGDGDFAPAIRALQDVGVRCEVISFRPNTSSDLIAVADEFIDIMKIIDIGRKKEGTRSRGMSAPEMPAKEVNPEFGFREASPHVAAAALAAIKGGGGSTRRSSSASAPRNGNGTAEPANGTDVATLEEGRDGGRRRRRRGGRGRGRGRHEETVTEPAGGEVEEPAEITWQELDDLSQLEGADEELVSPDEREITFGEADAATLAELGISQPATGAEAETAVADEPAKPARRRRSAKVEAAVEAPAAEGSAEPAEKPARRRRSTKDGSASDEAAAKVTSSSESGSRRRRTTKATGEAVEAGDEPAAATKPTRRRRTTKATSEAGSADAGPASGAEPRAANATGGGESEGDAPQGIWQRFRSARTTR
jgi:uncharacterized LabA/DUF88 family protein